MASSDILKGQWKQIRGKLREQWGKLTDDEVDQVEGQQDKLIGLLQEKYGYAKLKAEQQVNAFLENFYEAANEEEESSSSSE